MSPLLLNYEIAIVRDRDADRYIVVFGIANQAEEQRAIALPLAFEAPNGWMVVSAQLSDIDISTKTIYILGYDHSGDGMDRITKKSFPTLVEAEAVYYSIISALEDWESHGGFSAGAYDTREVVIERHHCVIG